MQTASDCKTARQPAPRLQQQHRCRRAVMQSGKQVCMPTDRQPTSRHLDRQTGQRTACSRQTDQYRKTDRQTHRPTDTHTLTSHRFIERQTDRKEGRQTGQIPTCAGLRDCPSVRSREPGTCYSIAPHNSQPAAHHWHPPCPACAPPPPYRGFLRAPLHYFRSC